jgi:predicted amidophosphoribosyltransferase
LQDARVLLVDDVLTTGATCHEVAGLFKRAGASMVAVAVLARGVGDRTP